MSFQIISHPVAQAKLAVLRDKNTTALTFRLIMEELGQFLAYEGTRDLATKKVRIETPLEVTDCDSVAEDLVLISVMRAGNGMLSGMMRILPFATVGHIGIYRDRFIQSTVEYYLRIPKDVKGKRVLILDPLLATGDTLCAAIERLKEFEVGKIRCLSLLASPQGVARVRELHPDVEILSLCLERELDAKGYLLPGIGDAGDRLYDTV